VPDFGKTWYDAIMELLTYKVKISALRDGGYMVTVPTLPGCITWGKDYDEALTMAAEAIRGFVEALAKAGQVIPVENKHGRRTSVTMVVRAPALA
jgi:antitoxin HicB